MGNVRRALKKPPSLSVFLFLFFVVVVLCWSGQEGRRGFGTVVVVVFGGGGGAGLVSLGGWRAGLAFFFFAVSLARSPERQQKKHKKTHYRVSGGPMTVICHSNRLESSTRPAEKPSTGFLVRSGCCFLVLVWWSAVFREQPRLGTTTAAAIGRAVVPLSRFPPLTAQLLLQQQDRMVRRHVARRRRCYCCCCWSLLCARAPLPLPLPLSLSISSPRAAPSYRRSLDACSRSEGLDRSKVRPVPALKSGRGELLESRGSRGRAEGELRKKERPAR